MTKKQAEIIMAYAKGDMRIKDAGNLVHMHPTTISYHLGMIKEETGRDPKNFFDLCYLVSIAAGLTGGNT